MRLFVAPIENHSEAVTANAHRQLKLGHMIEDGDRTWTDWRHPDAQPDANTNFAYHAKSGPGVGGMGAPGLAWSPA